MHGPDGRDYPNRVVYNEIDPPRRLVYTHDDAGEAVEPVCFQHTVTFEPHGDKAQQTRLTLRMVFPSAEERERIGREYGAVEGGLQTVARLAEHLAGPAGGGHAGLGLALPSPREIMTWRLFEAPRGRVFEAFTKPEHVRRWLWGPDDWPIVHCEIDLKVGGAFRYVWRHRDKGEMAVSGVFREITPPERIVHTELFDQDWTDGEALVTTAFAERAGDADRTVVTTTVRYASRAARDRVVASGMAEGMAQCYDRLEGWLVQGSAAPSR